MKRLIFILLLFPMFCIGQGTHSFTNYHARNNVTVDGEFTSDNSFAEMYDPSTVISTASSTVYYALSGWTAGDVNNATVDVVDSMMIIDQAGTYLLNFSLSYSHSQASGTTVHICGFKRNGDWSGGEWIEFTDMETERKMAVNDIGNVGGVSIQTLTAGDTLGIRAKSTASGNLTINHGNFSVIRIK